MVKVNDIPEDQFLAYDIETAAPHPLPEGVKTDIKGAVSAAYAKLHMIAFQVGVSGEPELVDDSNRERFRRMLRDPNIIKVSYNGINFDDMVLWRYKYFVEPRGRHDMYLALKTVAPTLPSYSLKFVNKLYFGDWHEPEGRLWDWLKHNGSVRMYAAPHDLLSEYCKHDVRQTVAVFRMIWEIVQRPLHWGAYRKLELKMAEPLHEMILIAGEYMDVEDIDNRIREAEIRKLGHNDKVVELTEGKITNALSAKQVSEYLPKVETDYEFEISEHGNLNVRKSNLLELMPTNPVAKEVYECRSIAKDIGYLRSYYNAARYERDRRNGNSNKGADKSLRTINFAIGLQKDRIGYSLNNGERTKDSHSLVKIKKSYYLSSARTRRILSSSMFGINFQNQNDRSKVVQLVPKGWLGCWYDLTQIENLVHIWASSDEERRASYEADPNWSEYVWLVNMIMGEKHDKNYWDSIPSPENPQWSIYKQYKTIKLALNFGMGPDKFSKTTGLDRKKAVSLFNRVQAACPAIRGLQLSIRQRIMRDGFVQDPFGHIYSGSVKQAYKVVAYLVQGCGTGSVPKAMTVANYETLHSLDTSTPKYHPFIKHPFKQTFSYGVLTGTTHDECAFRVSLGLPTREVVRLVKECITNMTTRFASKFEGMPMRTKTYFSITNAAEHIELDHRKEDFEERLINEFIRPFRAS